jgi:surface carbohydrate biosynthesis protein (TIGR04326 family)
MTLLTQKCNYSKSPQITDAVRLIAFFDWFAGKSPSVVQVELVTANASLCLCIRSWCEDHGFSFAIQKPSDAQLGLPTVKQKYAGLPNILQALLWLPRHLLATWALKGVGLKEWQQTPGRVSFFSYLINLTPQALEQGSYSTRYWAHLPDQLTNEGVCTNWLHLYMPHENLTSAGSAADLIKRFNQAGKDVQRHVTLHAFLSTRVVLRTLSDWICLMWKGAGINRALSKTFRTDRYLLPLFTSDWNKSLFGKEAISNVLTLNLIESAVKSLPTQKIGVYLQENQAWEFGLIHAWQAVGHKRLVGAPHSTVRFWDLRYFFDKRSYIRLHPNDLPLPEFVGVNGSNTASALKEVGYPVSQLIDVEALRYLHLANNKKPNIKAPSAIEKNKARLRILVLSDIMPSSTQRQMDLLVEAARHIPELEITLKPHPGNLVEAMNYRTINMTVTMEPIEQLLLNCDVAYTSDMTSAAVDAYCAGVPVVSVLDPTVLNLSPLRGCSGVDFASTPEELISAFRRLQVGPSVAVLHSNFFTLDSQLSRWKKLLINA